MSSSSSSGNDLFAGLSLAASPPKNGKAAVVAAAAPDGSVGYVPPMLSTDEGQSSGGFSSGAPAPLPPQRPSNAQANSAQLNNAQTNAQPQPPPRAPVPVRNAPVTDKLLNLLGESAPGPAARHNGSGPAASSSASLSPVPVPRAKEPTPAAKPAAAAAETKAQSPPLAELPPPPPPPALTSSPKFAPAAKKQAKATKKRAAKAAIGTQKNEGVTSEAAVVPEAPIAAVAGKEDEQTGGPPAAGPAAAAPETTIDPKAVETKAPDAVPNDSVGEASAKNSEPSEGSGGDNAKDVASTKPSTPSDAGPQQQEQQQQQQSEKTTPPEPAAPPPRRRSEKPPALPDETHHGGSGNAPGGPSVSKRSLRGVGVVRADTPIPNSDVALRLLRKFAQKTRPGVPESHGGTQPLSMWTRYVSGTPTEYDTRFDAYQKLMESIATGNETEKDAERPGKSPSETMVDAVLGEEGDTMQKARSAMACFCHLMGVWGHASSHMAQNTDRKKGAAFETFCGMVSTGFDTASSLVTHGCLDGVMIGIGPSHEEYHKVADVLAESVFSVDLSQPASELSAVKFLLSLGCRVDQNTGEALLRGSHLLQTIRILYHVFLSTPTDANKTTARAALQQLVTSVFLRMVASGNNACEEKETTEDHPSVSDGPSHCEKAGGPPEIKACGTDGTAPEGTAPEFPSENHRDAFLVLRSLCKLSMRAQPHGETSGYGQEGLQHAHGGKSQRRAGGDALSHVYAHAMHPAVESKILALDLLLYVLKRTKITGSFLQDCGPHFHYAIRNYLCVSLLKNCTSNDTTVVQLSLMVFVPIFQNFRSILKTEIEAFVTNVFFVILDSKNSPIEHKSLVVTLFNEICSDPTTLAEIFLNYDCDLSAVDLFHRIINTLSRVARTTDAETSDLGATAMTSIISSSGGARMERLRTQHRELRLNAMRALRQVLASLNASIVEPMKESQSLSPTLSREEPRIGEDTHENHRGQAENGHASAGASGSDPKKSLVEIYDDKKKRREEDSETVLRFNQKPKAGIAYATKCGHIDSSDPADVARFLHKNKDRFEKTQIGEYLGREPDYDNGMPLKVLHEYVHQMDFDGLTFDNAIRYYLSGFRLPGEAQKIDRILEKFAERYSEQNPDAFPSADVAFILSFSIIMLNTDLHNPSIKEERKMTKDGFIRNNRGICDGQDLPKEMLIDIFDRIKENQISLKEDDDARERAADSSATTNALNPAAFFTNHYDEVDKTKESNFIKERDQIVRTTESLLKRRRHGTDAGKPGTRRGRSNHTGKPSHPKYVRTDDSGLRDEYVAPMFEVTWGPALAAFSTAMESANGTVGALLAIATDKELEAAAINAAETIEVCLTGFRFAICTAGLVGNDIARESFVFALSRFSQLGTGVLLEPRHVRCIQTMLAIARSDGELLGASWEHVFKALSEINRFHQLFQLMARNDRAVARAAERRQTRLVAKEKRREAKELRRAKKEESDSLGDASMANSGDSSDSDSSFDDSSLFDASDDLSLNDDMDTKEIDEANARTVYEAVAEDIIEAIYERSSSLSTAAVKEFILQLCRVSRMEISDYGGFVAGDSNEVSLTSVQYRKKHDLLVHSAPKEKEGFHHHQTNIYNLQKLVEVTHYNMDSRPRLVFNELWTTVSASLTSTALHSNPAVAMYAVDSFRQLCIQYLQREELGVFEFQRRFLKPLETVMARSEISTTKELLLRCVERIILMFGSPQEGNDGGKLRSGWRPVLKVLGLAGRDSDEEIAKVGFEMLNTQITVCLDQCKEDGEKTAGQGVLLIERFVDLVDALLIYVGGPHEEMGLQSIDDLLKLCDFLADESTVSPLLKKRRGVASGNGEAIAENSEKTSNEELELWWPILLGLSRSVGDERKKIRQKSLESLTKIVSRHFFPSVENQESLDENSKSKYVQTLQLVYRGIFSPVLEFGDESAFNAKTPTLPSDMERFLSAKHPGESQKLDESNHSSSWIDTTFDPFMDDCVHICIRSLKVFDDDTLIEDIFAMFNSCFISESGALAAKGLRRLEIFVTSDLPTSSLSNEIWATVSHMLRRSLHVRGLPKRSAVAGSKTTEETSKEAPQHKGDDTEVSNPELEQQEMLREFVAEDKMFLDRRFIGSNAIAVIGKFMETERFKKSLSLKWRLFLLSGLGRAIKDWEMAAGITENNLGKTNDPNRLNPPSYRETAYYGRKWMNRFLLQIAAMKEIEGTAVEGSKQAAAQDAVKEQTEALVSAFLEKETVINNDAKSSSLEIKSFDRLMNLVQDMLAGYAKLTDEHLEQMPWLNPVLSSCIHTSNEDIRLAIQKLVERLH